MVRIKDVKPRSLFRDGDLSPGDMLVSINGHEIADLLDLRFHSAEEELEIEVHHQDGRQSVFEILKGYDDDLGLEFDPDRIKVCKANCDFCFVRQQPKKVMRRSLYIKDDDYRLSFMHGNYVTLTNLSEQDWERIITMHLSPMYVSVHATDDSVRRRLLRQDNAPPIMECLHRLIESDIEVHTQAVITPGLNDTAILDRTVSELSALYPRIKTLSVVPVGLTKFRDRLEPVASVTEEVAGQLIDHIDRHRVRLVERIGVPFADCADEMYVQSGREVPPAEYYGDFQGLENGVGLLRQLIDGFESGIASVPSAIAESRSLALLTGVSAFPTLRDLCGRLSQHVQNLMLTVLSVPNDFWGHTVTVSGLLTGDDMMRHFMEADLLADAVLVPPDCLNSDGVTLDDMTLEQMAQPMRVPVLRSSYELIPSIRRALQELDKRTNK